MKQTVRKILKKTLNKTKNQKKIKIRITIMQGHQRTNDAFNLVPQKLILWNKNIKNAQLVHNLYHFQKLSSLIDGMLFVWFLQNIRVSEDERKVKCPLSKHIWNQYPMTTFMPNVQETHLRIFGQSITLEKTDFPWKIWLYHFSTIIISLCSRHKSGKIYDINTRKHLDTNTNW